MNHISIAIRFKLIRNVAGLTGLPDDGVVNGQPGLLIPHDRCFPLIRNADPNNLARLNMRFDKRCGNRG